MENFEKAIKGIAEEENQEKNEKLLTKESKSMNYPSIEELKKEGLECVKVTRTKEKQYQEDAINDVIDKTKKSKKTIKKATKLSSEEYIKLLEEKIQLMNIINALEFPGMPQTLSTSAQNLIRSLVSDHHILKDKYIELIKNM